MKTYRNILVLALFTLAVQTVGAQEIKKWKLSDLKSAVANAEGPTIFNFWATFCKPCVAEIPHFQELAKKYQAKGVKLVFVSLDLNEAYPKKVRAFVQQKKLSSPVVFLDETNADLFCPAVDESWSGAIPATLFVNKKTGYRKFYEDELKKETVEAEIKRMLGSTTL
jgi:thiol-disulfide isomerase/thioredoxin